MSLRKKTLIVVGITFLLLIAVGYFYTQTIFIKSYLVLEEQEIDANVRRFQYTLESEIDYLGKLTNDWAAWDDTYEFMQSPNQKFISSNLVDGTFSELGLNFTFFLDDNGNAVFIKAFDLENAVEIPVENSLLSYVTNLLKTSPITEADDYLQGVFSNHGSPVIFAARPILTSLDEGPTTGTLVFGKYLDGALLDKIKSSVDTELHILPYSQEEYDTLTQSGGNSDFPIDASRSDKVYFYSLIRDVEDTPIFIIEQILPRNIYQQGLSSRREFLIALVLVCIIASALAMVALEYGFLRRFSKLTKGVTEFDASSQDSGNMILKGSDEVSILSVEMNRTLSKLAETQNELTTHLDFEKLLVGISTKFINLPIESINDGINRLLKVIGEFSKVDRSYILLLHENDSKVMDHTHEWCAKGIHSLKESHNNIFVNSLKWWIKILQKGETVIINDISGLPEEAKSEKSFFTNQSVLSHAAVPLIIGGKFIGLLAYDSIQENKIWTEQTILLLEVISTVVASAIDRNRHEKKILLNQINSANLNEITRSSIGRSTLKAACREISIHLARLISSDNSYLILFDGKRDVDIFSGGHKTDLNKEKRKILKDLLARSHNEIVRSEDSEINSNPLYKRLLGASFFSIPLITETANLGIIVFSFKSPHAFSNDEIAFCQQSAAQITLIILKTKALETARQKSVELSALRATIADITSELELENLLHTLLERAIKLMKADGGDFCMVDEETGGLKVVASINLDKEYVGTQIRFGEGASGKVLATRKTLVIKDYSTWPDRLKKLDEIKLRSTVMLPLLKGERVLGTLGIFHSTPEEQFSAEDLHMLSLFAQHASIAIENAMLFEKVQLMARIDEVTGLYNRRAINDMGEYEINRASRLKHSISLAMVDLDNFKQVNDQFSHKVGDEVLREIAQICKENIRSIDVLGRYGGDEFVILLPETDGENAYLTMERLRKVIDETPIVLGDNTFHMTVSIGLVSHKENAPSITEIMNQADSSLYTAKNKGKNSVRVFQDMDLPKN